MLEVKPGHWSAWSYGNQKWWKWQWSHHQCHFRSIYQVASPSNCSCQTAIGGGQIVLPCYTLSC